MSGHIFRKGLNLKQDVAGDLARDYHSKVVENIKGAGYQLKVGRLTLRLAKEFGFCYGVDRAVDYAYQTRKRFPDRTVYLTGEIIHNPHVNQRLRSAGIRFLTDPEETIDLVRAEDVVILPAFGVTVSELEQLDRVGCTLVDTTCGSVLNVWKNVRKYVREGYTAVIHGKVHHEETQATASQALSVPDGRYLVIIDRHEASLLCDYIRGRATRDSFLAMFAGAVSSGFSPERDLERVGLANQTTMLMSESLEIGEMIKHAMLDRYDESTLSEHYRAFETICSATQDRQDAVQALLEEYPFDLMIVIGGYNSSNTRNLAKICADRASTYHIANPSCLESSKALRHRPTTMDPNLQTETLVNDWLPAKKSVLVGVTAGASTPDNIVGEVIERLVKFADG